MEEVRQLVQEEGREARNLVAFHVSVDTPARVSRKPPRSVAPPARRLPPRSAPRLRSASAGRDKRSELRARYWALLFGDLQRAVGEIYNTVEAHENLNECQEVILVLENYTRDFKALGEWFRLKWEYDNTPPLQRPQSLAWEIRKTDFVRPESRRTHSVKSSPSVSGKNSPLLSGNNTPSGKNSPVAGKVSPGSGKISPRITHVTSPKANLEFFSGKITSKTATKPEPRVKESRLSEIKEKDVKESNEDLKEVIKNDTKIDEKIEKLEAPVVEIGKAKECQNVSPKPVVIKSSKHVKTSPNNAKEELSSQAKATVAKMDEMENEFLAKQLNKNKAKNDNLLNKDKELELMDEIEPKSPEKVEDKTLATFVEGNDSSTESAIKSEDNFADVSNESSPIDTSDDKPLETGDNKDKEDISEDKSLENTAKPAEDSIEVATEECTDNMDITANPDIPNDTVEDLSSGVPKDLTDKDDSKKDDPKKVESKSNSDSKPWKPAYSQAAAKPKLTPSKIEVKPVKSTTTAPRNKNVVEVTNAAPKTRQFPKKNQTSKCSYPFNLTTGRTSLFDGTPTTVKVVAKKPVGRNQGSGDAKTSQSKVDPKTRPPRPTSLKIEKDKDKSAATLENIKDYDEFSSSDTIVTQIDLSRIESSESLKTLVPDELLQVIHDVANSIEVLNVDGSKNDNEGWLTVKSRRLSRESKKQSKSHWANRFHQPSATTSLPTLTLISPKQESNPVITTEKLDRAKSEQPEKRKPEKVKVVVKPKCVSKIKDPAMIRQKSDVTGLKTNSARNKARKAERMKDLFQTDGELTKNRLHSSLESLTTGLARSQESTEETFDFDKWKAEFKSTFKYLDDDDQIPNHNEILKSADPSEMSEIAEMTSQIEENEKKISWALDFQSDVDQRKLCEEEDLLNRQIMELQQVSDIDLDTETDDTETDAEILCEDNTMSVPSCSSPEHLGALAASLEDQYETALEGMTWAERVDTLVVLQALVARDPGRAQQLHAKLSQGIKRRGSFQDALRRLQAKQARAERQRREYQTERARKIHQLLARVEEVKVAKNQLIEEKRLRMERRLQKAAENRDQHLKDIVRKAHDEEEKLREIAFIKQLEAENRRHDFLAQCRSHTARLRLMRRDRMDRLEQKAAREAAVGARRQALELARKLHVETLLERRKERDARVEELKELKKQERDDAAREKAEGVKSRLSALAAAAELEADALRSRIRDKQDASQQRLESRLQAIREKATAPRQPTTSESQDQNSKEERELQEEAERLEQERKEREKQKAIKKKARKVKQKLLATCNDSVIDDNIPLDPNPATNKLYKVIQQLTNTLTPLLDIENTDNSKKLNDVGKINENVGKINDNFGKINENVSKINENVSKINENVNKNDDKDNIETNNKKNKKLNANINCAEIENIEKKPSKSKKKKAIETIENVEADIEGAESIKSETNSKKKKKHKNSKDEFRPKLSKANSICSSISDTSKASYLSERRIKVNIDMVVLERQLNELHRIMEKLDKTSRDNNVSQKIHGLKILGHFLAVAAEREDLAPPFSVKSLSTAVSLVSRLIRGCTAAAAYFISTNSCVHMVKLFGNQLEKDLQSDQKEIELAKQLSDCLSCALDSVLTSTRVYEEREEKSGQEMLSTLRSRAHTLVSYLCLCGCVSRAETACEPVREGVHTLLTVCADLCQQCDVDTGCERSSALQSLRCALGTSLCGARAELCSLLMDADPTPAPACRAAIIAHLLRALAELDHKIVQESFGEGGWPLEFRAAVARLLSQHAPNDKEAPRNTSRPMTQRLEETLAEAMVLNLIILVGFVVVNNPQLQDTICDGWGVIKTLCTLPANWLVSQTHSQALLPTLVALAERPSAAAALASELSMKMLDEYLESPEAQNLKLVQVIKQARAKKTSGKK